MDIHKDAASEEAFETGATPDQTITVMLRGEQELESFNGGVWRRAVYRAGTVGLTLGGETDRLRRRFRGPSERCEKVSLYLPARTLDEATEQVRRVGRRAAPLTALAFQDPAISATTTALLRAMRLGAPDLYAQAAVQWLAMHLVEVHGAAGRSANGDSRMGEVSDVRLSRVLEYMRSHLAQPLSLDVLAAEAGVSKFHFVRLFREKTGVTPYAHLLQLKLEAAQHLLASTDMGVEQVAQACGFSRGSHLRAAFTRRYGVAPTRLR